MIAPVASPLSDSPDLILCYYTNTTAVLQTACVSGSADIAFERIVFPQQRLLFEAPLDATLEVRTCSSIGETIVQIPCLQLQVNQRDLLNSTALARIFDSATHTNLGEE